MELTDVTTNRGEKLMKSRNRSCPRDWLAREDRSFAAGWHLQAQELSVQQGQNY